MTVEYSLPSSSLAITTPLPALAEKRNPALKMVKMANPFAFSSTVRGMTYVIRSDISCTSLVNVKMLQTYAIKPVVGAVDERFNYNQGVVRRAMRCESCDASVKRTYISVRPSDIPSAAVVAAVC